MTDGIINLETMTGSNPLLLTITQVSLLLNLGRTKTYELIMSNRIKSVKLGRKRLVPRVNVERYVTEICNESFDEM